MLAWAVALQASIASRRRDVDLLIAGTAGAAARDALNTRVEALIELAGKIFDSMDFALLFDSDRHLLSIGYRVNEGALDQSYYDLLASEARLASFVAIAKGDVPMRHWFRLGRLLTQVGKDSIMMLWSGSMF